MKTPKYKAGDIIRPSREFRDKVIASPKQYSTTCHELIEKKHVTVEKFYAGTISLVEFAGGWGDVFEHFTLNHFDEDLFKL